MGFCLVGCLSMVKNIGAQTTDQWIRKRIDYKHKHTNRICLFFSHPFIHKHTHISTKHRIPHQKIKWFRIKFNFNACIHTNEFALCFFVVIVFVCLCVDRSIWVITQRWLFILSLTLLSRYNILQMCKKRIQFLNSQFLSLSFRLNKEWFNLAKYFTRISPKPWCMKTVFRCGILFLNRIIWLLWKEQKKSTKIKNIAE